MVHIIDSNLRPKSVKDKVELHNNVEKMPDGEHMVSEGNSYEQFCTTLGFKWSFGALFLSSENYCKYGRLSMIIFPFCYILLTV